MCNAFDRVQRRERLLRSDPVRREDGHRQRRRPGLQEVQGDRRLKVRVVDPSGICNAVDGRRD